jgi:hypothetical protein
VEEKNFSTTLAQAATTAANFLADRRGVPIILGFIFVALNLLFQFIPGLGWFREYDIMLHLGVLLAIGGLLLAPAL